MGRTCGEGFQLSILGVNSHYCVKDPDVRDQGQAEGARPHDYTYQEHH